MLRVTSFLDTENTIDFFNPYYVSDNAYLPPESDNVDFLLDPNINMRTTAILESADRFSVTSALSYSSSYLLSAPTSFDSPNYTVDIKNPCHFLDEFYHPTSYIEFITYFEVNAPFTFMDEQSHLVRGILDSGIPVNVKSSYIGENKIAPVVMKELVAFSGFAILVRLGVITDNSCSVKVVTPIESLSSFTKRIKNFIDIPISFTKVSKSFKEFNSILTSKVSSPSEWKTSFNKLVKSPITLGDGFIVKIQSATEFRSDARVQARNSLSSLNDCKNFVTSDLEQFGDCVDKIAVNNALEFYSDCESSLSFSVTMTVEVPDLSVNVKVQSPFESSSDCES